VDGGILLVLEYSEQAQSVLTIDVSSVQKWSWLITPTVWLNDPILLGRVALCCLDKEAISTGRFNWLNS